MLVARHAQGVEAHRQARTLAAPWGTDPKQRGEPFERPTLPQPIRAPGGLLLAAAFVTFAVGAACMHSYTVFLIAFIEAFGWSRAKVPSPTRCRS